MISSSLLFDQNILIFHFTFTIPGNGVFFIVGTFWSIYAVVSYVAYSTAITANLILSASYFGMTVIIAFVTGLVTGRPLSLNLQIAELETGHRVRSTDFKILAKCQK